MEETFQGQQIQGNLTQESRLSYFSNPVQEMPHGSSGEEAVGHTRAMWQLSPRMKAPGVGTQEKVLSGRPFCVGVSLQDTAFDVELCYYRSWTPPCKVYRNVQQDRNCNACNKQNAIYISVPRGCSTLVGLRKTASDIISHRFPVLRYENLETNCKCRT